MAEITVQETQVQVRFKTETEFGLFWAHVYPFDGERSTFIVETDEETWRRAGLDAFAAVPRRPGEYHWPLWWSRLTANRDCRRMDSHSGPARRAGTAATNR